MPIIAGELQTDTENATDCADLATFSCGDKRHSYEDTVERIIARHHAGTHPYADNDLTRDAGDASRHRRGTKHHLVEVRP